MRLKFKRCAYLITGAVLMANFFGCSGVKFEKYTGRDPLLNISMDYISGWQYNETRGSYNSYAQVMFFPFEKGRESPRAIMAVTVKDSSKAEFTPRTIDAVIDDLLAKRMQFKDAEVLSKSKTKLLNTEAAVIELSYLAPENLLNVNSGLIPVKEKVVIFKKEKYFYFLRYQNSAEDFNQFNKAFIRILRSLKLK